MSNHHIVKYGKKTGTQELAQTTIDTSKKGLTLIIAPEGQGYTSIPKVIASSLARDNPDTYYVYHVQNEWNSFLETIGTHNLIPMEFSSVDDIKPIPDDTNILFISLGGVDALYNRQDIDQIMSIVSNNLIHVVLAITPEIFNKYFNLFKKLIQTVIISSNHIYPELSSAFGIKLTQLDIYNAGQVKIMSNELTTNVTLDVPPFIIEEA